MNYPIGSLWRKWDLHVHTPSSLVQEYGGNTEQIWERFISELEALPEEFKVIGINDYLFVDGYERVLNYKKNKRLKNIDLIFPIIEIRLKEFVGHDKLKRLNYHILFADESIISAAQIKTHFLGRLQASAKLDAQYGGVSWGGMITEETLKELGKEIKKSLPEDKREEITDSDLQLGFNSINFSLDEIQRVLGELGGPNTFLENKYLKAIGKSEWEDFRWDGSIAEKKSIINGCDFVFCASPTAAQANASKDRLSNQGVNDRLLHSSDAHRFSVNDVMGSKVLGNCYMWLKADTTFAGLKQAMREPARRFIGVQPEINLTLKKRPRKYIEKVRIKKKEGAEIGENWFDNDIDVNPELVAIIGNKGKGKSALVDVIGLLGNTYQSKNFSFLSDNNFNNKRNNKAKYFSAILTWRDGGVIQKSLDSLCDLNQEEFVKYIPQNYLESICNEHGGVPGSSFDKELKNVIFSHVPVAERLQTKSLDELIDLKSKESGEAILQLRNKLRDVNQEIVSFEKLLQPQHKQRLDNLLINKTSEYVECEKQKPTEVSIPVQGDDQGVVNLRQRINNAMLKRKEIEVKIAETQKRLADILLDLTAVERVGGKVRNLDRFFESFKDDVSDDLVRLGLDVSGIAQLQTNYQLLNEKSSNLSDQRELLRKLLSPDGDGSLAKELDEVNTQISTLQVTLDGPNKVYQDYLNNMEVWKKRSESIVGTEDQLDTLLGIRKSLAEIDAVPLKLEGLYVQRSSIASAIYSEIKKHADVYKKIYAPIQKLVEDRALNGERKEQLNFEVSIVENGFLLEFFSFVSQGGASSFSGVESGSKLLDDMLKSHDFNKDSNALSFVEGVIQRLKGDYRSSPPNRTDPFSLIKKGKELVDLYDFIFSFSYLKPLYTLKLGDKELSQLSPGERGALLLVFYLLIDHDTIPLIIDQPEENLDNQTVYEQIVPLLKEAKTRRQVIIVTHNPNLAVVCDAEQVICAQFDKKSNCTMNYVCGGIENPTMNRLILDILEGTRPAFDNRDSKYHK